MDGIVVKPMSTETVLPIHDGTQTDKLSGSGTQNTGNVSRMTNQMPLDSNISVDINKSPQTAKTRAGSRGEVRSR